MYPDRAHVDSLHRVTRLLLAALPGTAAVRRELVGYTVLAVPALLADVARDINTDGLGPRAVATRVRRVVDFVTRALTVAP